MKSFQETECTGSDRARQPCLIVGVDTEEEFDWSAPLSASSRNVSNVASQQSAQRLLSKYNVKPVYLMDFPVVDQAAGYEPIREFCEEGSCSVGAHLQAWVNPPLVEEVGQYHSFPGNLPGDLERDKLKILTDKIQESLGVRPRTYRAGRYGIGSATPGILRDLGYTVDMSVLSRVSYSDISGPDFSAFDGKPFWWDGPDSILEIPITSGYLGAVKKLGPAVFNALNGSIGEALHIPGILARSHLLERIRLTPEGITLEEMKRLTRSRMAAGQTVFNLTYHSPSLVPGHTPYVQTERDLALFLERIEGYLDFFTGEINGRASTPDDIFTAARSDAVHVEAQPACQL